MMVEDGKDMMSVLDLLGLREGASPVQLVTCPGPEVEVRILRRGFRLRGIDER
jgi:hypothetical protein